MQSPACHSCSNELDAADNFCRRCGVAVERAPVPAVRQPAEVTLWRPEVSPVMKGAALMVAGTIGQFVVRRVVSNFVAGGKGGGRSMMRLGRDGLVDEAQIITETVMMRRVRIRRQA